LDAVTSKSEEGLNASVEIEVVRCSRDFRGSGRISKGFVVVLAEREEEE
jgi:hypothetical protein